jgi:hypothetical protein
MILGACSLVGEQFVEIQSFSWRELHGAACIAFAVHFFATLWLVLTSKKSNLLLVLVVVSLLQLTTNPWEDVAPWDMVHSIGVLLSFGLTFIVFLRNK